MSKEGGGRPRRLTRAHVHALTTLATSICVELLFTERCNRNPGWEGTGEEDDLSALATVHVAYGSDANNFPGLLTSMLSLSRHLGDPGGCTIHLVVPQEDLPAASELVECFRSELADMPVVPTVLLQGMRPLTFNTSGFRTDTGTTSPLTFAKFALHRHGSLLGVPRVIWLDTDTVVQADIARLYRTRMEHALAVTLDFPEKTWAPYMGLPASLRSRVPDWDARLFTNGVMIYDLTRWREEDFEPELANLSQQLMGYDGDQLPMNLLFGRRFDELDGRWNVFLNAGEVWAWLKCQEGAWILHLTGIIKYWHADWHASLAAYQDQLLLGQYQPKHECQVWRENWRTSARMFL